MIPRILYTLLTLFWSLWFGGIIALFIFVQTLFARFGDDRLTAGKATSALFLIFDRYQLILAALALICTVAWRCVRRGRHTTALFTLLSLAALAAVISAAFITPQIEQMRLDRLTHEPRFGQLHGLSMLLFTTQALLLLIAGLLLPRDNSSALPPPGPPPAT